jgi:hypothetical protein
MFPSFLLSFLLHLNLQYYVFITAVLLISLLFSHLNEIYLFLPEKKYQETLQKISGSNKNYQQILTFSNIFILVVDAQNKSGARAVRSAMAT